MIKINCDLCGKTDDRLFRALIEDVELNVCNDCSKFGKVIGSIKKQIAKEAKPKISQPADEKIELLVENYAEIIRKKRESMKLSQEDFAKKINEKESIVHKIETGHYQPSVSMARKLEKILGIKLIENYVEEKPALSRKKNEEGFTIGDFIKIRK